MAMLERRDKSTAIGQAVDPTFHRIAPYSNKLVDGDSEIVCGLFRISENLRSNSCPTL
jgi:hypothetical protein